MPDRKRKKPLVPKLRFPEFRDAVEWEVKRLGKIGPVSMCKRVLKKQTSETGDIPFYKIGTFGKKPDAYISMELYEKYKKTYPFPNRGDILISASGTIGRTVVYDGKPAYFQDSNMVWIANDENIVLNVFLNYCYKRIRWQTDDNTIARLYNDNLRRMKVVVPSIPEQQKIADCLSSLDALIELEAQKCEALKAHKKGLMQQLFPREGETKPRLRFPGFRNAGPWEVKRLGEICTFLKGKGLPKAAITPAGSVPCVHYGELFTDYGEVIRNVKCFTNSSNSYVLSEEDDVLMPTSDVTPNGLAKASCLKHSNVVLGGDILVIRLNKDLVFGEYLSRLIRFREQEVLRFVSGTTVFHLYPNSISKLIVSFPSLAEQQKIADCLSSLDKLIELKAQKVEALKQHKKGLMQQLFPQEVI